MRILVVEDEASLAQFVARALSAEGYTVRVAEDGPTGERLALSDDVVCVVLGRGANAAKVDHWLAQAATVDGFVGFAIGRSIWWDPLKAYVDGKIERVEGARRIAENYLRFVKVYEAAEGRARVAS